MHLPNSSPPKAFTRLDVLALLAAFLLLVAIALPTVAGVRPRSTMAQCLANLRLVGRGFHAWAADQRDKFPWEVGIADGGAAQLGVVEQFRVCSNEFRYTWTVVCPADGGRSIARSWGWPDLDYSRVSYFNSVEATVGRPRAWMAGDRNLMIGGSYGTVLNTNSQPSWDLMIHVSAGNLLLTDGSVWQTTTRTLPPFLSRALAQFPANSFTIQRPAP